MRPELTDAFAVVLRDLRSSGAPVPSLEDHEWTDLPGYVSALLGAVDGSSQGIQICADDPPPARIAALAEQVQEWVIEELWELGRPATWPECPDHPDSHPMEPKDDGDRALWLCPRTFRVVAEIGSL